MRRILAVAVLASCALMLGVPAARAHAILASSVPADGAELSAAPSSVTLTFTEVPDAQLSQVHVLDTTGKRFESGPARAVSGQPRELQADIPSLAKGVYVVTWRVLSRTDGHITGGTFAFGVGVSPSSVTLSKQNIPTTPSPSAWTIVARWAFYAGLMLLLGGAWIGLLVWGLAARAPRVVARTGLALAVAGLVGMAFTQASSVGVSVGSLLGSSTGRALYWRAAPLALGLVGVMVWKRGGAMLAGLAAELSMLAHVAFGHAGSGEIVPGKIAIQWAHFAAAGIWIGGLVALLAGLRAADRDARARGVRRFSQVALYALLIVAATGVVRAINEAGSIHLLFSSTFGQMLIVKAGILAVIAGLAALNRWRNVAAIERSDAGLMAASRAEIALAAAILVSTGILSSVAPGQSILAAQKQSFRGITASASDFATTVKVSVEASPGTPGPNKFIARATDFDSGKPVDVQQLPLTFTFLGRPGVPPSKLILARQKNGSFSAAGSNLAFLGPWQVSAFVARGAGSAQVLMRLLTTIDQHSSVIAGSPTLYQVQFTGDRMVQFYVDPGASGTNEVHATYFAKGGEFKGLKDSSMVATPDDGSTIALASSVFSVGHFIGRGSLTPGRWRFDASVLAPDGSTLAAYFEQTIGG